MKPVKVDFLTIDILLMSFIGWTNLKQKNRIFFGRWKKFPNFSDKKPPLGRSNYFFKLYFLQFLIVKIDWMYSLYKHDLFFAHQNHPSLKNNHELGQNSFFTSKMTFFLKNTWKYFEFSLLLADGTELELVSKELNHLAAILHVYAGGLNFMK